MQIINKMQIDLLSRGITPKIDAVQNDANSRGVEISLTAGGTPWKIPAGVTAAIAFRKPDGTNGLYDKLLDGTSAILLSGSTFTAVFAPEMLTVPGLVRVSVIFNDANLNQLATFPFDVVVAENPSAGKVISNNYYNYQTLGDINKALDTINTNLSKAVLFTEQELSEVQQKRARQNIGAAADSEVIKYVNGHAPGENGAVQIIDDTKAGADAWSSKNTVDRLCPEFTQSGSVVSCQPVEGYPLEVLTEEGATKVTRCSKNFLPYPYSSGSMATNLGVTITYNGDGSITFNGTTTGTFYYFLRNDFTEATLPAGSYCISTAGRSDMSIQVEARKDGVYVKSVRVGDGSFTVDYSTYDTVRIFLYCASGKTVNETIYPQLERGSSATAYEPSNVKTFSPGDTIPALPGVNTIYADAGLVTVTGKADPVAIINNLQTRLAAIEAAIVSNT